MSCEWESKSLTFIVEKRGEKKSAFLTMRGPVHETQCIENMDKHFLGVPRLSVSGSI